MSPAILEMLTSIQLGLLFSPDTVKNIDENQEQGDQHRHSRLENYWQSFSVTSCITFQAPLQA